jgi:hypothetical protein
VVEDLVRDNPQNLNAVLDEQLPRYAVRCSKDTLRRHLKRRQWCFKRRFSEAPA